ncbi:MAG: hypothetical protein STSR0009_28350 [Methanoregula sp.]
MVEVEGTNLKKKRSGGRLPKHLKKIKRPTDPWKEYRPQQRTWACENCKLEIKRDPDIEDLDFSCPQCRGRFIRTSKVETTKKDRFTEYGWLLFLDSRKGEGRKQFLEVQSILLERELVNGGWMPYREIEEEMKLKCPISKTQLIRLLYDMMGAHIVDKIKKKDPSSTTINKNRIFYRYNPWATVRTLTEDGFKKEYSLLVSLLKHHSSHNFFD